MDGAIGTIFQTQKAHAHETKWLHTQIETLERRLKHYELTYPDCPKGYKLNTGRSLSFYILGPNKITVLVKWVCQFDDWHVAGFSQHQWAEEVPYIVNLFLTPSYDIDDPPKPLFGWFWALLMGLSMQYHMLWKKVAWLDDWAILAEVKCHHAINDKLGEVHCQISILNA